MLRRLLLLLALTPLAACGEVAAERVESAGTTVQLEALLRESLEASDFASRLTAVLTPTDLARELLSSPDLVPSVLRPLGAAWIERPAGSPIETYLVRSAQALGREIADRGPPWTPKDVDLLLTVQLIDPLRFIEEPEFRQRILTQLPRTLDPATPRALRDRLLFALNQSRGFSFDDSERIELAWGAAERASLERRLPWENDRFRLPRDPQGPIEASIYSLSSQYFSAGEADRFLAAVEEWAPSRRLLVLTDLPLKAELGQRRRGERTELLETHGRRYSPWPRDPLILSRDGASLVLLERPNRQREREDDSDLGRELIQQLPSALDEAWREVGWSTAPVPFQNGQALLTEDSAWISIHTLEPRILEILGLERVPVPSFATSDGIDRYLEAAGAAAAELTELYGRRARFVHPLPADGPVAERSATMQAIGGGAGFDLDSLVTFLPGGALVAEIHAGRELLQRLPPADWQRLRTGYRLVPGAEEIQRILISYQSSPRVNRLETFLDAVAEHLAQDAGLEVERVPHFLVPTPILAERDELDFPDFQISWNNVVVEESGRDRPGTATDGRGSTAAEGFSSLLETGDQEARQIFARLGSELELLPPLVPSILRNGGYRCASNHLRMGSAR